MIEFKADDCCAKALGRLERARRTSDPEAQLVLLQEIARQWWRIAELRKAFAADKT
jgi:hypothetical protein